jgi:hypothetical protein
VKNLILLLSFFSFSLVYGQSDQNEYLEAKRLLSIGQYSSAKAAFASLKESKTFSIYAKFYYGMSAYKQGNVKNAMDMWRQMLQEYPSWNQKNELYYWLSLANFESKVYILGIRYAEKYSKEIGSDSLEKDFINKYLFSLDISQLKYIYAENENKFLASILISKLIEEPIASRESDFVDLLIKQWGFEGRELSMLPENYQTSYNIAVMMPFMFDSLAEPGIVLNNSLVTDLYQGMLLGSAAIDSLGIKLNLYPFDTKRDENVTDEILKKNDPNNIDLIIGPLYTSPNQKVNDFSMANTINKINPISGNSKVLGDNPYAFLFMPTYETMAVALAEHVKKSVTNKTGMIFFEQNERDSLFASVFRAELEKDTSFRIVVYEGLNKDNARDWLDTLISQYDVFWTKSEADSLRKEGNLLRSRRLSNKELRVLSALKEQRALPYQKEMTPEEVKRFLKLVSYDSEGQPIFHYEKTFYMEKDSIGFVLGSTRKNHLANNLISVIETRDDSTQLYGLGEWIDFTMISFEQLDRIGVQLAHAQFVDINKKNFQILKSAINSRFSEQPTFFHFLGYELIMQLGNLIKENGEYFQIGLREGKFTEGYILEGIKYGAANDNQVVPVVKFNNSKLEIVNRESYEN